MPCASPFSANRAGSWEARDALRPCAKGCSEAVRCRVTLIPAGYTVLEAFNGLEAVEVATIHSGPIDLILTDVVMPKMSGHEAATQILALRPAIKVIHVSGHADEMVMEKGVFSEGARILRKPVTKDVLLGPVREDLGNRQTAG